MTTRASVHRWRYRRRSLRSPCPGTRGCPRWPACRHSSSSRTRPSSAACAQRDPTPAAVPCTECRSGRDCGRSARGRGCIRFGSNVNVPGLLEVAAVVLRRNVDETSARAERHRLPVVSAERTRTNVGALVPIRRAGHFDGAPGLQVDMRRPVHFDLRIGGEQLAGGAIEHVEESVLRRLHDHLALACRPS